MGTTYGVNGVDYPSKDSLCIPWPVLLGFLMANSIFKWCMHSLIRSKRQTCESKLRQLRNGKVTYTATTLPIRYKNEYLTEYLLGIHSHLMQISVPNDIALKILGFCVPVSTLSFHDQDTATSVSPVSAHVFSADFTSMQQFYKNNSEVDDNTNVILAFYIARHNACNEENNTIDMQMETLSTKASRLKAAQTVYIACKACMEFICTLLMLDMFIEWSFNKKSSLKQFIGFMLFLHYHPSFSFTNLQRIVRIEKSSLWLPIFPWILFFVFFVQIKNRHFSGNMKNQIPESEQFYGHQYIVMAVVTNALFVWFIWLVSVPWVFAGGALYFIGFMWFIYIGPVVVMLVRNLLLFMLVKCIACVCQPNAMRVVEWMITWPRYSAAFLGLYCWALTFLYHATSIMYITGIAVDRQRGELFRENFLGLYCSPNRDIIHIAVNTRDWRIVWITLSWIL